MTESNSPIDPFDSPLPKPRGRLSSRALPVHLLATPPQEKPEWLLHGLIARSRLTLLTSQWKSGKTTLLSVLLAKLHAGGELASLAVRRGRAVVVSEEGEFEWQSRGERLDFGPENLFICRPFNRKPRPEEWLELVQALGELREQHRLDLAVIDTISSLTPAGIENNADRLVDVMASLRSLARMGMAVLLLHHPRKGPQRPGQAARGTGALAATTDVVVEMGYPANHRGQEDRRRRLFALSRYEETRRDMMIELSEDRRSYSGRAEGFDEEQDRGLDLVFEVLGRSPVQLTRRGILAQWPQRPAPAESTLWRWLERGVLLGLVCQAGSGRRGDPLRYWLPGREVPWEPDMRDLLD